MQDSGGDVPQKGFLFLPRFQIGSPGRGGLSIVQSTPPPKVRVGEQGLPQRAGRGEIEGNPLVIEGEGGSQVISAAWRIHKERALHDPYETTNILGVGAADAELGLP